MRGRIRAIGATAAIGAITCAVAAQAVSEDFTVAAGATGGASPACAEGKRATGGGYRSETSSWVHRAMNPQGRRFRVALQSAANVEEQSARAIGLCARKGPLSAVKKRVEFSVSGEPVVKTLTARCPRGTKLAGGGFTVELSPFKGTIVLESRPVRARSWKVRTTQSSNGEYALRVRAICDDRNRVEYRTRKAALSDASGPMRARRGIGVSVTGTLEPRCRSGERASAGGFASLGEIRPSWSTVAPAAGGYDATFRYGYASGNAPEGDLVGYALCRS